MGAYNKRRRERDFNEGFEERYPAAEEARRAGWIAHEGEYGVLVWTHPDHPDLRYYGVINIPEKYRRP